MRKLAWFALGFGAAAALCAAILPGVWSFVSGALCAVALIVLLAVLRRWSRPALLALGLAAGFVWFSAYDLWITAPVRALDGQTLSMTATVRDDPQDAAFGARVYADASLVGKNVRILLYYSDPIDPQPGDSLRFTARFQIPEGEDYDLYYRSIGVDLIGYVSRGEIALEPAALSLRTLPLRLRSGLKARINTIFPAEAAPLVRALLTGDRSGLSYAQRNELSITGIAHIVAISGMHVSILLGVILLLSGRKRWLCAVLGIPAIFLFVLVTGAMPSVVRAAVMQALFLLAPLLRREYDPATGLGAAALCILIPNPWAIANLSFQLSFGAMAGIYLLSGRIFRRISEWPPVSRALRVRFLHGLVRYLVGTVASTCGACLFTTPLVACRMGGVSLVAMACNLLTLWAVSLLFELSLALCVLSLFWLGAARFLSPVAGLLAQYILAVAGTAAKLPLAAVYTQNVFVLPWLVFVYAAGACCLLPGGKKAAVPALCVSLMGLCLCLWLGRLDGGTHDLRMRMLDVGQGQCLLFEDGGVTLMYDCGGDGGDKAGEDAARLLLSQGTARLDILVLSHYDADHAGGVCQLLERLPVTLLYLPDLPCDTSLRADIEASALANGTELRYVTEDEKLDFASSQVIIFAPVLTGSDNEASLALLYSQGSYDILATGDMTAQAERLLLSRRRLPDVEVLVAGHHGSAGSTCDTLLAQTTPETVLISVGEHNFYGHPAEETLARIEEYGAQILRTDQCGTITIRR